MFVGRQISVPDDPAFNYIGSGNSWFLFSKTVSRKYITKPLTLRSVVKILYNGNSEIFKQSHAIFLVWYMRDQTFKHSIHKCIEYLS
jgi:hypothetical protein